MSWSFEIKSLITCLNLTHVRKGANWDKDVLKKDVKMWSGLKKAELIDKIPNQQEYSTDDSNSYNMLICSISMVYHGT